VRANTSVAINLSGLVALTAGTKLTIHNIGAFNIILNHANTSSASANRFSCPDAVDLSIHPGGTADLWYDGSTTAWKVYGGNRSFNFIVDGTLTVGGNTSANGNLNVAGLLWQTGNATFSGFINAIGALQVGAAYLRTGAITPTQLSANVNDYNPTSLATCSVLRVNSSAIVHLTGLTAQANGTQITVMNIGSNNILLNGANTSSAAANRFEVPGSGSGTFTLTPSDCIQVWYDGALTRWQVMSHA
jgi:hypothetical protein